jgi:hypothetical protein
MVAQLVAPPAAAGSSHAADAVAVALCLLGDGGAPHRVRRGCRSTRAAWTAFAAGVAR